MKYLIIPVIILLVMLGACKKNSDSAVPDTHGNFLFVNAIPNNWQFDVRLDTNKFASNVGYGMNTGYKSYRAQKYNLIITRSGQPNVVLYNAEIFLRNNRYYSAYLGADSAMANLLLIATEDDLSNPGEGLAKFRVINFAQAFKPNRTPLGIDVLSDTFPRFFRGLTFPAQTGFAPIAGDSTYKINFRWADSSKVLTTFNLPAKTGKAYTLISNGYPLDTTRFKVLMVQHN
jgi:hypothetical protein